jgi:uncharacterized membrane protein
LTGEEPLMRSVTFRRTLDRLRVNLWFTPLVGALAAVILAWTLAWVDGLIPNEALDNSKLVLSGSATELRSILVGMAGITLATTGVVFSLLTVPLSTVASQYGSRLLQVFRRSDHPNCAGDVCGHLCHCLAAALSIPGRS